MKILLCLTRADAPYVNFLKPIISGRAETAISIADPETVHEVVLLAKKHKCSCVATSSEKLLRLLLYPLTKEVSIENYAGSIIKKHDVEFLVIQPLEQLASTSTGKFLAKRYFSKFIEPSKFISFPELSWEVLFEHRYEHWIERAANADFISIDIETVIDHPQRIIACVGFTMVNLATFSFETVVIPMDSLDNVAVCKILCESPAPKLFQNGKYDNSYLLRYNICVYNWLFDTINLFHSWYSELPKRLDFVTSFSLRDAIYWKNESSVAYTKEQYYGYNARDAHNTACAWISLLSEAPEWALRNYTAEFLLVFPCLLAELTGLVRDNDFMERELERFENRLDTRLESIRKLVGDPTYNPSSSQQTLRLIHLLGCKNLTSSDKQAMDKAKYAHPLNQRILSEVEDYRKDRKLVSSYLRDKDAKGGGSKSWNGRIYFSLSPSGTDTSRLACKESSFWCGWQIQNIPRDRDDIQIKGGIVSDDGFYFGEGDYSQAEARDTAYLSGDTNLIAAVDDESRDFHGHNAAAFFGIPYDQIVESSFEEELHEWIHKVLNKPVRQLSKNTNHGSNYNMGPGVMLDTMGIRNVIRAQVLLKLPVQWSPIQVCAFLLARYEKTYPIVKGDWYEKVKTDVATTQLLVGPTGWTRYCFGNPSSNKRDLNRYVAHPPQSLNAQCLNAAYLRVLNNVWYPNRENFKLGPQIHDSILFQYRIGHEHLAFMVRDAMEFSIPVKDTFGITRNLSIPIDLKGGSNRWSELRPLKPLKKAREVVACAEQ